jgi:hypothetical protein
MGRFGVILQQNTGVSNYEAANMLEKEPTCIYVTQ